MRSLILLVAAFAVAAPALAAEPYALTVSWDWPVLDCDGGTIALEDIDAAEIYLDTQPIPSAAEAAGDTCNAPTDEPPAAPIVQTVTTSDTTVVVDVERGHTWHARMRVQVNGQWSNLSAELTAAVPFAKPDVPIIIRFN